MVYTGKSKNNMDNNWGYPDDLWSLHMLGEEKPEPWCRKWPGWRFQTWREWSTKVWQCLLQRSQNRFAIRTCPTDSTYIYSIYTYIQYIRLYKWVYIIYIYTHILSGSWPATRLSWNLVFIWFHWASKIAGTTLQKSPQYRFPNWKLFTNTIPNHFCSLS